MTLALEAADADKLTARNFSANRCMRVLSSTVAGLPNCVCHTNELCVCHNCVYGTNQTRKLLCKESENCAAQ